MVSKKSAATRRRVFATLDSVDADTVAICALSAAAHSANTLRARKEQAVENAPAVLEAVRRAEESGEVLIRGLDWTAGPGVVRWAVEGWLEGKVEKVLRVGLKKSWGGGRGGGGVRGVGRGRRGKGRGGGGGGGGDGEVWDALVLLSARRDAEKLLEASWNEGWIFLLGKKVTVERRGRLVPGIGGAWGSRREPWSKMFPVAMVECGEMKRDAGSGEDFFSSFWECGELLDTETVHVEINRASHVIAISLDQEQMMLVGTVSSGKFERKKLKMRIEIHFRSIIPEAQCHRISEESPHTSVYFRLAHPPEIFREHPRHAEARAAQVTGWKDRLWDVEQGETPSIEWFRTGDPTESLAFSRAQSIRVHLKKINAWDFMTELQKTRLVDKMPNRSAIVPSKKPGAALDTTDLFVIARDKYNSPYSVRYEVECLISCGALLPSVLVGNDEFWSILGDLEEQVALRLLEMLYLFSRREHFYTLRDPVQSLKEAMTHMPVKDTGRGHGHISTKSGDGDREGTMSLGDEEGDAEYPMELFNRSKDASEDESDASSSHIGEENSSEGDTAAAGTVLQSKAESNLTSIRRLVLSPTRVIACRPEFDLLNRVLRHFHTHKERFIRVVFADEDRSSIFFNASDDVHARVRLLLDGVEVAGERFEFLAFSSSQLRFQAAWFFNEAPSRFDATPHPTTNEIRAWMGDFSAIRIPAKFAARMGQAFSSTVGAVRLDHHQQGIIEDIFPRQRKYFFSDGCGLCSADIARFIARELGLREGHVPSAFQVRFAGAKGMLVVWDDKVPREDGYEIMLRPSMIKFQSEHKAIEVVGYSKRLPLFLNYQLILLLVGLGIPDKVFVGMQRKILKGLDAVMKVSGALPALNLLYASGFGSSDSRLCVLSPMLDVAALFRAGLNCVNCEFLFNAMIAFRAQCLSELLKGRLPLGIDKGCSVIGVLDEAGVLEEDEVFLQCSDLQTGKVIGVEGPVVVGRSPCLHKGDVQPLKAYHTKYLPKLGHLVDVLVFSQK